MYHGTSISRGTTFLEEQKMKCSHGDGEWLGDGIYLYRDKIYAYRWITILYKGAHNGDQIKDDIFKEYMILCVEIEYKNVFSLLNPEHRLEFITVKNSCAKKAKLSEKLKKYDYTDGVVLNFMFKALGYDKQYDMVEAVFPLNNSGNERNSRLGNFNEYQLCIKNPERIKKISDCSSDFSFEDYQKKLNEINQYRTQSRKNGNKYKTQYKTNAKGYRA